MFSQPLAEGLRSDGDPVPDHAWRHYAWRRHVEEEIVICLAGITAEEIAFEADLTAARIDLQHSDQWMKEIGARDRLPYIERTGRLLNEPHTWRAVQEIAQWLVSCRRIKSGQVNTICFDCGVPRVAWPG